MTDDNHIARSDAAKELMRTVMREGKGEVTFDAREQRIVEARLLSDNKETLKELAAEFGVSDTRIDQIAARAIARIQRFAMKYYRDVPVVNESIKERRMLRDYILHPFRYKR